MRQYSIKIGGITKCSTIDFPGTIAAVVFLQGCNLRCPYCHNPQFVNSFNKTIDTDHFFDFLSNRKGLLEGVVISGGEPTLWDELPLFIREIKDLGFIVKLDTNGLRPDIIKQCAIDYLALDIKSSFDNYKTISNQSVIEIEKALKESVEIVKENGDKAEIRITLYPQLINKGIIEQLAPEFQGVKTLYLQKVKLSNQILDPTIQDIQIFAQEQIDEFKMVLANFVENVFVR